VLKEAIGDLLSIPPPSRVFLMPSQVERIAMERENVSGEYWSRMEFPDSLDKPSRIISSHTVGGVKKETIVLAWTTYQAKHPPLSPDEPSHAITSHLAKASRDGLFPIVDQMATYRRLTVKECMRIQSFPDWWAFPESVSTSRQYKLIGEAVPPILAYRIAIALAKTLGLETREPPKEDEWGLPYFRRAFADYYDSG
jgi:site-specific DNA-cytosine methylase